MAKIDQLNSTTEKLRRKVAKEFGANIRGEEKGKAEAARRIKQWGATLSKTAFQSV
ncbi:hypothetical protein FOIG_12695 [Fusarium odoratissimum NRRL 54006]|uniref:Uncharacterized protein n=2 Tax=Fusarium oxysporum species complex TaxID=171631 RepID=X0JDN9_FUSO5|nr:uncharacterized protein FOIG_12695 [Fusarium odoratissimum NRRL 54006]EXL94501.1 hypothetical protein FOIG_12695 [Fusarium odoratissimum NRRL 54006]TXB96751.1 hypothetical protein FocTR4_00011006 [Fusarium oxysporum f. sp. cubense]